MRPIIRAFFRTLRIVLGPFMLLLERLRQPKGVLRAPAAQQLVDQQCESLKLYQFSTCPFCIKVRQEMRALSLPVERRDAQHNLSNREELVQGGGAYKVPCLKVTEANGQARWIYESGAIISYLRERFSGV
jgi:glutaredoxin